MKLPSSFARTLMLFGVASACTDLTPPHQDLGPDDVERGGSASGSSRGGSSGKKGSGGAGGGGTITSAGRAATATGGRSAAGASSSGATATNSAGRVSVVSGGAPGAGGKVTASTGGATGGVDLLGGAGPTPGGNAGSAGASERSRSKPPFFSEYVEGSGNYKALELAIAEPGHLEGCAVRVYANGSLTASRAIPLSGLLTPETPLVICSPQLAALSGVACNLSESLPFNGNDVVLLACDEDVVDAIGQLGNDPGTTGWGNASLRTQDLTLRRACTVVAGDQEPNDPFDPAANGWFSAGTDAFDGLGVRCEAIDDDAGVGGTGGVGGEAGTSAGAAGRAGLDDVGGAPAGAAG